MIDIKAIGFRAVSSIMGSRLKKLNNRRSTNAKAVIIVDRWVKKNFEREGRPVDGWKDLSPVTIAARRKGGKGAKILQDTGNLKNNWKHYWDSKKAHIRSGASYAVYHDSEKTRDNLPRRQILPDEKHIRPDLIKVYGKFVGRVVRSD